MVRIRFILLYLLAAVLARQACAQASLSAYQYWFDNDHNGAVTVPIAGGSANINTVLATASSPPGYRALHFRVKDASGKWSSTISKMVIVGSNLEAYQYWFDDDFAAAQTVDVQMGSNAVIVDDLPTTNTTPGIHTFHFRARAGASWSSTISKLVLTAPHIDAYEYWYDDAYDQRITQTLGSGTSNYVLLSDLDVFGLHESPSLHQLRFRARSGAQWSSVLSAYFVPKHFIVAYEYWYATDPAHKFQVPMAPTEFMTTLPVLSATSVPAGGDTVYFRVKDDAGRWSSAIAHSFVQGDGFELNVPYVSVNDGFFTPGSTATIVGGLFTPNCLINLNVKGPGGVSWTSTVVANEQGSIMTNLLTGQDWPLGYYRIQGTDACTQAASQVTIFQATGISPEEEVLVLDKSLAGSAWLVDDEVTIAWSDLMYPERQSFHYPTEAGTAMRPFIYFVEYWDGAQWQSAKTVTGKGVLYQRVNLSASFAFPDNLTTTSIRVRDGLYAPNRDETGDFSLIAGDPNFELSFAWDYSWEPDPGHPVQGIAADGIARFYVVAERKAGTEGPSVSRVELAVYDPLNNTTAKNLAGSVKTATQINTYSTEANGGTTDQATNTQAVNDKYWFWYVAPMDFTEDPTSTLSDRTVQLSANFYDNANNLLGTVEKEVKVVRPPLALVHGLGSNAEAFSEFRSSTGRLVSTNLRFTVAHAFTVSPVAYFSANGKMLLGLIPSKEDNSTLPAMVKQMRSLGYACNQLDYVGHSMGGLIIRSAEENPEYKNQRNYELGYIHKLITINSPHLSSPLADLTNLMPQVINDVITGNAMGGCDARDIPLVTALMESLIAPGTLLGGFFRKDHPEPVCWSSDIIQANAWWEEFVGSSLGGPALRYSVGTTAAVKDLRVVGGVNFGPSQIPAHTIVADALIPGYQDLPIAMDLYIDGQDLIDQMSAIEEQWGWLDELSTLYSKGFEADGLSQKVGDIMEQESSGERYINLLSTFIDWYNNILTAYNATGFIMDCDLVVPLRSQLSDRPYNSTGATVYNGFRYWHLPVLEQPDVADKVLELLNTKRNSPAFQWLLENTSNDFVPGGDGPEAGFAGTLRDGGPLDLSLVNYEMDTAKIKIGGNLADSLWVDSIIDLDVQISDVTDLKYVDLKFQGRVFRRFAKVNTINYQVPVRANILDRQSLRVEAYYDHGDSATVYVDAKLVNVIPSSPIESFRAMPKVVFMTKNDTVGLNYRVEFGGHITEMGPWQYQGIPTILNEGILQYDQVRRQFFSLDTGQTIAYVPYRTVVDTVYFVIGTKTAVEEDEQDIGISELGNPALRLDLFPNPTRSKVSASLPAVKGATSATIMILGLNGQVLQTREIKPQQEQRVQLDITHYPAGGYYVRYDVDGKSYTGVVVKL